MTCMVVEAFPDGFCFYLVHLVLYGVENWVDYSEFDMVAS